MKFDKKIFMEENSEFLYNKLISFIRSEINDYSYQNILKQLMNKSTNMNYEGNQYRVIKKRNSETVLVVDEVSEEHGVDKSSTRFTLSINELIELINGYAVTDFEIEIFKNRLDW